MSNYIVLAPGARGTSELDTVALGRGGEGSVHKVLTHDVTVLAPPSELVAKLYHEPSTDDRQAKATAMISNPPSSSNIAWPSALVFDGQKAFAGFLMPRIPPDTYRPWSDLSHAARRRSTAPNFSVLYGLTAIRSLFATVHSLHLAGHRVGDINESNIFVGADAEVMLVDMDSAEVKSAEGTVFPCLVGKPEYTAPELQGKSFRDQNRTVETDIFGLGVAAYQMLTGGAHPTDSTWSGATDAPSVSEKMRAGSYPGLRGSMGQLGHPARIPASAIPRSLVPMLLAMLSPDPSSRGSLPAAIARLDSTLDRLRQCDVEATHWYDSQDGQCGWCAHVQQALPDPWSITPAAQQAGVQRRLSPISFADEAEPVIRRAPAQRAGANLPPPAPSYQAHPAGAPPTGPPSHPTGAPHAPNSPPPPPQPTAPQKTAKGKTILTFADGTSRVRPPLVTLFKAQPKLALQCAAAETPDFARFWWPSSRALAQPRSLALGLIVGLAFSALWLVLTPLVFETFTTGWVMGLAIPASLIAGFGASTAAFLLAGFALWDRHKASKAAGSLDRFTPEALPRTVSRFALLGVLYGPFLVIGVAGAILALAFHFAVEALRPAMGQPSRY